MADPTEEQQRVLSAERFYPNRALARQRVEAQQGVIANTADSFKNTAAYAGYARVRDDYQQHEDAGEGMFRGVLNSLFANDIPEDGFNADDHPELFEGVPVDYHNTIRERGNYNSASNSSNRIRENLERNQRLGLQDSTGSILPLLAGGVFDIDMPLTLMTGGAYKAIRGLGAISKAGSASVKAQLLVDSALKGTLVGAGSGAVAGMGSLAWDDTADWTTVVEATLMSGALGGVFGGVSGAFGRVQGEFHQNMTRDTRVDDFDDGGIDLSDPVAPDGTTPEVDPDMPFIFREGDEGWEDEMGIGASSIGIPGIPQGNSGVNIGSTARKIITAAMRRNQQTGAATQRAALFRQNPRWAGVATNKFTNIGTDVYLQVFNSKSEVAKFLSAEVMESAQGLTRQTTTAASRKEVYTHRQMAVFQEPYRAAFNEWRTAGGQDWAKYDPLNWTTTAAAKTQFSKEVRLELHARRMAARNGTTYTPTNPIIAKAADAHDAGSQKMRDSYRGRENEIAVNGADELEDSPGWFSYAWSGNQFRKVLDEPNGITEKSLTKSLQDAYTNMGMTRMIDGKPMAYYVAHALVQRFKNRGYNDSSSLMMDIGADGRGAFEQMLRANGNVSEASIKKIMDRITSDKDERGKVRALKTRNEIDIAMDILKEDGTSSGMQIADLFNPDLEDTFATTSRQAAGISGLARKGITSWQALDDTINAMRTEQHLRGETPISTPVMQAALSEFRGGPKWGATANSEAPNKGLEPVIGLAKLGANLSFLNKMGLTQLAETGVQVMAAGVESWSARGPMAWVSRELKDKNSALLDDLAPFVGAIGKDQYIFQGHKMYDEISAKDRNWILARLQRIGADMSEAQAYISMFNTVRGWQQKTVALSLMDRLVKAAISDDGALAGKFNYNKAADKRRLWNDLGVDDSMLIKIGQLVDAGVIEMNTSGKLYVNRLHPDKWSKNSLDALGLSHINGEELLDQLSDIILRNQNQLVQRSMVGEDSPWMHTNGAAPFVHLKSFPMLALQKQFLRNTRYMDAETAGTALMAVATAYLALQVRDTVEGRDRSAKERAIQTIGYGNYTSFIPLYADPLMVMFGMHDYRFNNYDRGANVNPAILSYANRAMKLPGAVARGVLPGVENDSISSQGWRALPYHNSLAFESFRSLFDEGDKKEVAPANAPKKDHTSLLSLGDRSSAPKEQPAPAALDAQDIVYN